MKKLISLTLAYLCLGMLTSHVASATGVQYSRNVAPAGYSGYITFIGNNEAGLDSLNFVDIGPAAIQCFTDILGRDQAEIAQTLQDAIADLDTRFGLTGTTLDETGNPINPNANVWLLPYRLRDDVGVRAYVVADVGFVPNTGWKVDDCGWQAVCVNPAGCPLGGDFSGQTMAFQNGFAYGDYIIHADYVINSKNRLYVLPFKPKALVEITPIGTIFNWEIESEDFGTCIAQGLINPVIDFVNGTVRHNIRNTITCEDGPGADGV